jgi:hypothetical protein
MVPGRQSVRDGLVNVGHRRVTHRRVYTVTDVTKVIDGVPAAAVIDQDLNAGQVAEQAIDYLAEDKRGTVWYLGSYTESYEGGKFVSATDGWLAGAKGAKPGIMMRAHPKAGTSYFAGQALGSDASFSRVVKSGARKCVPLKCFNDTVAIEEGGGTEWKWYAPGVGGILTEPKTKAGKEETELLVNATQLSRRGMGELSTEILKLDRHSRTVNQAVFGHSVPAKRGI